MGSKFKLFVVKENEYKRVDWIKFGTKGNVFQVGDGFNTYQIEGYESNFKLFVLKNEKINSYIEVEL